MTQFSLTISSAYCPSWGVYEGVREAIQNALDGRDAGHPMAVAYSAEEGMLVVTNDGVSLERSVWLLGTTTKSDGAARGMFGEGLALGTLALVRAGRKVRIINNTEVWSTSIKPSETFNEPVLTVSTRQLKVPTGSFSVKIEITPQEWSEYQLAFLDLQSPGKLISTRHGDILLDPAQCGRLYVKGIHVEARNGLSAGYDFTSAQTDRDRRMIYGWDFDYYTANAWASAWQDGHVTTERLLDLLESPTPDITGMGERTMPAELINAVADAFLARYGALSVPVKSTAERAEIEYLGRRGIVTSETLCKLLCEHETLSLAALRKQCRGEVVAAFTTGDLDPRERSVATLGTALVEAAAVPMGFAPVTGRLEIVEFRADDLLGANHYDPDTGIHHIRIARRCLSSLESYLRVLVHELAHDRGGDGEVQHERAEGEIFCRIIARSLDGFVPREVRQPVPVLAAA